MNPALASETEIAMKSAVRLSRRPHALSSYRQWLLPLFLALSAEIQVLQDATAQPAGGYSLDRYTIDSGSRDSSGGGFVIRGSIGQPDASVLGPAMGGYYEVSGGFWAAGIGDQIFSNGFDSP
jgi:hypothetical protein